MATSSVNVAPLAGHVPEGFKSPVCQESACGKRATWLIRGTPSLVACDTHMQAAIEVLTTIEQVRKEAREDH